MAFSPRAIDQGGVSTLTYTLRNGAAIGATSVSLSDRLPAAVAVAAPPDAQTTCTGGRLTAAAGTREIAYSEGALAAGASCTIAVDVTSALAGLYPNETESVTSSLGTSTAAEATLTVDPAEAPGFAKAFSPARVDPGGISRLTFTIDNAANPIAVGSLAFTDAFPDGLVAADPPNAETACGGTFAPAASAASLAFSGGSVAAGEACTIALDVQALRPGTLENLSGALASDLPVTTPGAGATLRVDEAPLSVSMAFEPPAIAQGGVSRLTHTLDNGAAVEATSVSLSDSLPADVVLADPPDAQTTCSGGTLTAAAGGDTIAFTGGALGAGASCTLSVDVTSAAAGSYPNDTQSVTSSLGTSTAAEATLAVDPAEAPGFARVFAPDSVRQGGETQIVFTLDNTANLIEVGSLAFTDAFPDGLVVADAPNATTACGGTYNPAAGATTLAFADGALAAGATCDIRVTLRAIAAGRLTVPAVTLTSNLAPATAAEATLTVTPPEAPGFAKAFLPARVAPGGISRLTFTIDNAANLIAVGSLAFTDAFPDGMTVAATPNGSTACGGAFAPAASAASLAFSGGSVAAGEACTIALDVQALRAGTLENRSSALASDLPVTTPGAGATLTVDEDPLTASMSFTPETIDQGGVSRLTYTLDNGAAVEATGVALSDRLPANVVVAAPPNAQTTCSGGRLTAAAGGDTIAYSEGALAAGASCTIAVDMTSATVGSYPNNLQTVTSSLGASAAVSARLTVTPAEAPGFARVFDPDSIRQGGETQIVFTLDNGANLIAVGSLAFTDAFPDGLVVADAPSEENGCGGTFSPVAGATTLAFTGGALAAGATCEIRVTLRAIAAGRLTVPAVTLRSNVAPAIAAEARLDVTPVGAPGFAKAFSPARVDPGGISRLTFTIDNSANLIAVGSLAFTDAFPDGLVAVADPPNAETGCGGTFAPAASATSLAFTGGSVAAGEACTIAVDLQALRAGTLENRSGALASDLPVTTPGARATLTVDEAPLTVSMAFEPPVIRAGGISTLTYTLDNGAAIEATSLSLSDRLPAAVVLADPPDAQTTCAGGGLTAAAAGDGAIAYSEGALAAGASCTITVDVTSATAGSYSNDTESVTSSLGTSTPAEATLTVDAAGAPRFARVFAPARVAQGGETQIVFTLDNTANLIDLRELAFTDAFPDGLVVADAPNATTACGGSYNPAAGATTLAFADGVLAAGATCEIRVTLRAIAAGRLTVPAVTLTSNLAPATAAEARLDVDPAEAPGFAKAFSPASVAPGGISRLTFTIDNAANLIAVGSLAFDDAFPDGLVVADPPNAETGCGGTFAPAASAASLAFTGGSLASGEACTIALDVQALRAGTLENRSSALASDLPVASTAAEATLPVDEAPLSVSMAFEPPAIAQGGVSRLTYTLDNGAAVEATGVALSDRLPAAVVVADPPAAQTTCGGRLTATAGSREIAYSEGALAAGASCTIAVDMTSATVGSYPNNLQTVTSSLGASAAVSARLTVTPAEAPGFARVFDPDSVRQGGETQIVFTLDNTANLIEVGELAFTDAFPDGLVVADTPNATTACGGTFSPAAGDDRLAFADGVLAAGATCEIRVTLRAIAAGRLTVPAVTLTSNLAPATAAEARLTVTPAGAPGFAKAFSPARVDPGGISRLTFTIDNAANLIEVGSLSFTDAFPDDLVAADPPNAETGCSGTFAPAASASSLAFSGGRVASGEACTIALDVQALRAGTLENLSGALASDLPVTTPGATATLTVDAAPLSVSMAFSPRAIALGGVSRLTHTLRNGAAIGATSVALSDRLPAGVALADPPDAQTTCSGGRLTAAAGTRTIAYSEGALAAGASCTIAVDVTPATAARYRNIAESVTSSLGTSTAISAGLRVEAVEAPGFAKAFSPARVAPGGISRLTFTIDNAANAIAVRSLAFTDDFPDGMTVAAIPNGSTACGGTFAPAASATSLAFTGGRVASGEACTIALDVQALRAGTLENRSGVLTSDLPVTTSGARAILRVDEAPLSVSMAFSPRAIAQGGVSRLTHTLRNDAAIGATSVALSDRLPAGVALADPPDAQTTCSGGRLTAAAGTRTIAYSEGALAAGASCTIAVDVTPATAARYRNIAQSVTSSLGTSTAVSAGLRVEAVEAPGFAKAFSPARVAPGGISRLTFTIDNAANAIAVRSLAFTDDFPDGMTVAAIPNGSTACGGTFAPAASATSLAFTGGRVASGEACTIALDVQAQRAGTLENRSGALTSDLPVATSGARATLTVDEAPLSVSMAFSPRAIAQGEVSRLTHTLRNGAAIGATSVSLSDRLPAGVALADPPDAQTTCSGGRLTAAAGTRAIAYSEGALAAGASCTIAVDVTSATAARYRNVTESVTSSLGTSTAVSAGLRVDEAPLSVSMAFSPRAIAQGGVSRLTHTLDNGAAIGATSIALSDRLPPGVTVADPPAAQTTCSGGRLTAAAGTRTIAYSEGALAAGASCTIAVDVTSATAARYRNIAESVTSSLGTSTAVSAGLRVEAVGAPGFAKAFSPARVDQGGISRLTFAIGNAANAIAVGSLAFTDDFPDGLVVADPPNAETGCGGTFAPAASATSLAFTGGRVASGEACTIALDVQALRAGTLENLSGVLASDLPVTTPGAGATLTVDAAPLSVSMAFSPRAIAQGGVSRLTHTLDNGAAIGATGVALSDRLPAGVALADPPDAQTTCSGGRLTAAAGTRTIAYSEGALAAGASCTIAVDVTSATAARYRNIAESVTSSLGTSAAVSAGLRVEAVGAPGFAKAFSPARVAPGGISRLTFAIGNAANPIAVGSLAFTDAFPDGLVVADPPNAETGCGGTFAPAASATSLAFTGGRIASDEACTIAVDVQARRAGTLENRSGALTSDLPVATSGARATLRVDAAPLTVSMAFSPRAIAQGGVSRLTHTLRNGAAIGATGVAMSDRLPPDVVVADSPDAQTTCSGGRLTAAAGTRAIAYSEGALAAGASCTIAVDVTSATAARYRNVTESVTSSLGTSTAVSAGLRVDEAPLSVSMAFSPRAIAHGGVSRLTHTLDNGAAIGATSIALSDRLPPGVTLADPPDAQTTCSGGRLTAAAGIREIAYSEGALAAGASCTIAVDVTSATAARYRNIAESVTSSLGTSTAVSAGLRVEAVGAPGFAKAFSPARVAPGGISRLTFTIDNTANPIEVGSLAFTDAFPDGLVVADPPNAETGCGGTFVPAASATSLAFSGGSVAADEACTIAVDVQALRAGRLENRSSTLTSDLPVATSGATATLRVDEDPLSVSMAFTPATIDQGGVSRLTHTLRNGAAIGATSVSLSDRLPAGVALADPPDAQTTCAGGRLTAAAGTRAIAYSEGVLAAGASCTIAVDVTSATARRYRNITESVTSSLGTSTAVSAGLRVDEAEAPGFAKAFSPARVDQGGISRLTFTIDNAANLIAVGSLAFDDAFPDGLVAVADPPNAETGCGGTFAPTASATSLAFSGGSVAAGEACTIAVDVQAQRAGTLENLSGALTSDLPVATSGARATLRVEAAPLSVSMAFSPRAIAQGGVSRLTHTLRNGAAIGATSVALSDRLPAGVALADPPDAQTTCSGGRLTAAAGTRAIAYSEGALAAGASCTIAVDVTSATAARYRNIAESVTSSLGTSTAISAGLRVEAVGAPGFAKAFSPARVAPGRISRLTFTIDNAANPIEVGSLAFTDAFPDGLVVADPPNAETGCGGTFAPAASATSLVFSGGSVASDEACTIAVDVQALRAGTLENRSGVLASDLPVATSGARATLRVDAAPLSVSMAFSPRAIAQGGVSRLTHTLRNGAAIGATGVALSDRLPADVALADPPDAQTTCSGGRLTAAAGTRAIAYSDGALAAGASCTIAVDVTSATAARYRNIAESVTSSLGTSTAVSAGLRVEAVGAPGFAKAFSPARVAPGGISRLTFTIDNAANPIEVGSLAFTDDFPDGMTVAATPNAETGCGGTFAPAASATSLAFTGGRIASDEACTIAVDVQARRAGTLENRSGALTSDLPVATSGARATLRVDAAPLSVSMAFSPRAIDQGGVSRLTHTLDNGAAIGATSVSLSDRLPADVALADPPDAQTTCSGGRLTAAAGTRAIAYSDGALAAGASCTIAVDVTSATAARYRNVTESVTSSLGTSTAVSAGLRVDEAPLTVSMAFSPRAIAQGGVSRLTHTLRNGAAIGATSVALSDRLPAGVALADPPDAQTTCSGGRLTAAAGTRAIAYSEGALAAGASCTIAVDVTSATAARYRNIAESVTSSLGTSTAVSAGLRVEAVGAPSFAKAFSPARVAPGRISRLTFTIDNAANPIEVGSLAFTDAFPDGLVVADPPNAETGCGGTFAPAASATSLAFTGGRVASGEACTIAVDVQARRPGTLENRSGTLTSDLPVATSGATATLRVDEAPLSVSMAFSPRAIAQGGVSRLTHTLRNGAAIGATGVALSDRLPAGVAVADPPDAQTTCSGGRLTVAAGTRAIAYSDGALAAGASCTIAVDVTSATAARYRNIAESVTSSLGTSTAVSAGLRVEAVGAPGFAKAFSPARVAPGGISRLTFTIDNAANPIAVGSLAFTDDFPDGLVAVADPPNAETGCGGTFAPATSAISLTFTGGSVTAGQTCTISVDVQALRAGTLENRSGALASDLPVTTPGARATLTVDEVPLMVSMAFEPPAIAQGGVSRLTYTLDNGAAIGATSVALSDRLPAAVALADPPDAQTTCSGGRLTAAVGTREIAYSEGALAAGASCTIAVDMTSATVGNYPNSLQTVTSSLGASAAVSARLTVAPAEAPGFARVFAPDSVRQGGETQIVFTLDNGANLIDLRELAFTDAFPDGLVVADAPSAENGCGGRFDPVAGATTLAFADGVLAAGATCEIRVTLRAIAAGTLTAPAVTLRSNLAPATAAETRLTVDPAEAPGFARVFAEDSVRQGGETQIVFTLDNTANLIDLVELAFTDAFPDGLVVADAPSAENGCGGRFDPVAGATTLAFADGALAAGATCEIRVTLRAIAAGTLTAPAVTLRSNLAPATAAETRLTVDPAEAPGFARVFAEDSVRQGGETQIVFTLDNTANLIDLVELAFTDAFPDGLVVADTPSAENGCGGRFDPVAGATTLAFADGVLAAGATCEIRVTLRAIAAGTLTAPAVTLRSNLAPATAAETRLTVDPAEAPSFARVFAEDSVRQGGETQIVFTLDNTANLIDLVELAFTDAFPDGLVVADTPSAENGCGGRFDPVAGATTLAFADGVLAAGATCEIRVTLRAIAAGTLTAPAVTLRSNLAPATAAETRLTVDPAEAPSFARVFAEDSVRQGGETQIVFTLDNTANLIDLVELAFTDAFPDGLVVADAPSAENGCGGRFDPVAGATTLAFADGVLAAGATCEIRVTLRAIAAGTLTAPAVTLRSNLAPATAAETRLTVDPAEAPSFARVFAEDSVRQGGETQIVFTLDNTANLIDLVELAFTDAFPDGLVVADTPSAENGCGGRFDPVAGATTLAFADGVLAAGATCEIRVTLRAIAAGTLTAPAVTLRSNLAPATAAETRLTVDPAEAPSFARVFAEDSVRQGGETQIVFTLDNTANLIDLVELAFTDAFPDGLVVADTPSAENGCGGRFDPVAGATTLAFADGVLAAGATCEIRVTLRAIAAGTLTAPAVTLRSNLAPATAAETRLTVDPAEAPSFARVFAPARVAQGGETQIVFTLDNTANLIDLVELAFTDAFPDGLVVADAPSAENGCGGRFDPVAGATTLAFADGVLAAGATCEIRVTLRAIAAGTLTAPAVTLRSNLAPATAAETRLTVDPAEAPSFARVFAEDSVRQGGETQIVFTLDNTANLIDLVELAFTDAFPDGLVVADTPSAENGCGGRFDPVAGATTLAFADGVLAAGATCEIRVTLRAIAAGTLTAPAVTLRSNLAPATAAEARLDVTPPAAPGFAKAFSPARVDPGGISRLTFTIDNAANPIEVGSLAFTDAFPDGLVAVADPPNAETGCGGIFAPAASEASLAFSGGSVAAGEACTIALDVQARRAGTLENRSGALTSDLPVARSGATATLTVDEDPLTASMSFTPATIDQGGVSTLTYTLHNGAAIEATSVALSDRLPAAVALADPPDAQTTCSGGRLTAVAGSREIAYSEGALAAGASCTIAVDVTSATAARYRNETESMTSSLGTSTAVSARLTVDAVETGTVTFKVESDTDGIFGFASAEPVLTTSLEVNGGTASTGALSVATGSHSVSVAAPTGVALTAIACDDTDSTANVYPATISVTVDPLENVTCTLTAQSSVQPTVETINSFLTRRADLILSSEPNPGRRIERLKSGSGHVSPLRFSNRYFPTDLSLEGKGGNYSLKAQGDNYLFTAQGNNYRFSTSLLPMPEAAATADISFGSAGEVAYVENHRFDAWFEAQYKRFGDGADERGDFAIAHAGVDYLLTPDVLVGALVSFDTMEEVTATSTVSGSGYMVGPYMTARLTPNLYFDGRFAAGKSDNLISPFNTYTDSFSTSRWLAMASLTGDFQYDNWTIQPHASLSHFRETQQSYVDSVGATIPSQTVRLGQIKIGPTFTGRFEGSEGWIYAPYLTVDAIYNVDDTTGVTLTDTNGSEVEGWRGRLKAGASMTTEGGVRFSFGANYDGIGQSESETWGLMFELSIPLGGS